MPNYPTSFPDIPTVTRASDASDGATTEPVAVVNELNVELVAVASELGLSPSGASATVVARLDALDTTVSGKAASSHSHTAADVSDFAEVARDTLGTALTAGTGITVTPNDGADTITVATSAILPTTVDAKGDLLVGTADNTVGRLAVGTNDYVLTADSSQSTGMKWAAASGGSGPATDSAFFTAYGNSFAATQSGRTNPLVDPTLTVPPTQGFNLNSQDGYFVRFRAQAARTSIALGFIASAKPSSCTWEAAIYDTSGNRLAHATGLSQADVNVGAITFGVFGSSASLTSGTDYYYALWSNISTGTFTVGCVTPVTGYTAELYNGTSYLAFTKSAMSSGLTSTVSFSSVVASTSYLFMAGVL